MRLSGAHLVAAIPPYRRPKLQLGSIPDPLETPVSPAQVMTALRDLTRATLHHAGWANIANGGRAHAQPEAVLTLHGIP
jgi:hypothetical protein